MPAALASWKVTVKRYAVRSRRASVGRKRAWAKPNAPLVVGSELVSTSPPSQSSASKGRDFASSRPRFASASSGTSASASRKRPFARARSPASRASKPSRESADASPRVASGPAPGICRARR